MSDLINNREEKVENENFLKRQAILKDLILQLHDGVDPNKVQDEFREKFSGVSSLEITKMEQALIDEGLNPETIQSLCSIHARMFEGSIEEVHTTHREEEQVGHPVRVMKEENFAIKELLDTMSTKVQAYVSEPTDKKKFSLMSDVSLLWDIDKHYSRKENAFFPLMEKYGITAPPKVMWGVDDEIREMIKSFKKTLNSNQISVIESQFEAMSHEITEMIFKEEEILLPMVLETFTEDEWLQIADDSVEIGYCIVSPEKEWVPQRKNFVEAYRQDQQRAASKEDLDAQNIRFAIGFLNKPELEAVLNTLPLDITFVDKNDTVKYFNQAKDRFFARTKSVIGRTVQNCHPPHSVNTVDRILDSFKNGTKDSESFWIDLHGAFLYISYYALRDEAGEYMGCLEVTQNIKPFRELEGQKRLLED